MMTRTVDFLYQVVLDGVDYCLLNPAGGSHPTIRMDNAGEIKTSFSGDFIIPDKPVSWLTEEIHPKLILDGVIYSLGVFLPATVSENHDGTISSIHLECYDRGWLVRDRMSETLLSFSSGTNYLDAVGSLLAASGVTRIRQIPTAATLTEDRQDWDIGTSYLTIANQLLGEINYKELWFDADGYAVLEPAAVPTAANILHELNDSNVQSLLSPQVKRMTDVYSQPNVFICICSNADKANPMVAVAENTNAQSPLSISRRGRRIASMIQVDNIASQEDLQSYANRLRDETMMRGDYITVQTGLLPGYGVADVTALQAHNISGICVEQAWSMELRVGGRMTHRLKSVVINFE